MGSFDGITNKGTDYSLFDGTDYTKNVTSLFDINAGNTTTATSTLPGGMVKKPAPAPLFEPPPNGGGAAPAFQEYVPPNGGGAAPSDTTGLKTAVTPPSPIINPMTGEVVKSTSQLASDAFTTNQTNQSTINTTTPPQRDQFGSLIGAAPITETVKQPEVVKTSTEIAAPPPRMLFDPRTRQMVQVKNPKEEQAVLDAQIASGLQFTNNLMVDKAQMYFNEMMNPDLAANPYYKQQVSNYLSTMGSQNQAFTDAYRMQLKSQGLDGKGAGNALLAQFSRGKEYEASKVMQNLSKEAMEQIEDMNKYGYEKGIEIYNMKRDEEREKREDILDNYPKMLELGMVSTIEKELGEAFPGATFDMKKIIATDPAKSAAFKFQSDVIARMNDPAEKKAATVALFRDNYQLLGYNTPEDAQAAAEKMNFNLTPEQIATGNEARTSLRAEAVKFASNGWIDTNTISSLAANLNISDKLGYIDRSKSQIFEDDGKTTTKMGEALTKILDAFGYTLNDLNDTSLTEAEMNNIIGAIEIAKASADPSAKGDYTQAQASALWTAAPSSMFDPDGAGGVSGDKAKADWYAQPGNAELWRSIIAESAFGDWKPDANGNLAPSGGFKPPWIPESKFYGDFYSWPIAYDAKGNALPPGHYTGNEPLSEVDPNPVIDANQKIMNDLYKKFKGTGGNELVTWKQWYYGTKGGAVDYDVKNAIGTPGEKDTSDDALINLDTFKDPTTLWETDGSVKHADVDKIETGAAAYAVENYQNVKTEKDAWDEVAILLKLGPSGAILTGAPSSTISEDWNEKITTNGRYVTYDGVPYYLEKNLGDDNGNIGGVPGGHKDSVLMQDREGNNYILDNTTQTPVKVTRMINIHPRYGAYWAWNDADGKVYYWLDLEKRPTAAEKSVSSNYAVVV